MTEENTTNEFVDPICGMTVKPETAAAKYEHNGKTVYFCAVGCKNKYISEIESSSKIHSHGEIKSGRQGKFIDPVCGMSVEPETSAGKYDFEGETFYFCSTGCLNKFRQNPTGLLEEKKVEKPETESVGTEYTCPMHPEIVRTGPGSCPICGMALEPKFISLDDAPDPEFIDMKRRFRISAALSIPIFVLVMAEMLPNFHQIVAPDTSLLIQFILATPVVLWGGKPFFERGWASVKNASPNMFTLIAIGTGAAYIYSILALWLPQVFPTSMHNSHTGLIAVYFEAAAVITTLVLLGQVLELRARSQTSSAIRELLSLAPETAIVVFDDGTESEIPLKNVQIGAKLRVRANQKVPTDGMILEGNTNVDESMVTGESIPVEKSVGDQVIGGRINGQRACLMRAEKVGGEAKKLSQATMRNIRQNLFFAFVYNLIGVPVAAGVLFPVLGVLLSPMIASAAMTFSSVSVILNALRLRKLKL